MCHMFVSLPVQPPLQGRLWDWIGDGWIWYLVLQLPDYGTTQFAFYWYSGAEILFSCYSGTALFLLYQIKKINEILNPTESFKM